MATTHVFIVDENTFKYHIQYMFAGTGGREFQSMDFTNNGSYIHHATEKNICGMIADGSRIRKDDYIIFYLQQSRKNPGGNFYGIFKSIQDFSFLDKSDSEQYLGNELGKNLNFRTLMQPFEVYAEGVSEWEALDEIKCTSSPYEMQWSLIYRKLKGNRGNTMITLYEAEKLFNLLRTKNNNKYLSNEKNYSFNIDGNIIENGTEENKEYEGRKEDINLLPRLIEKYNSNKAFEAHLQAYILKNIDRCKYLKNIFLDGRELEWIGNEVSCGVGMQRIDIMFSVKNSERNFLIPIELKAVEAEIYNIKQMQRYINWIQQYYIPNKCSIIEPAFITKKIVQKGEQNYNNLISSFKKFNEENPPLKIKYVEYYVDASELIFEEVAY